MSNCRDKIADLKVYLKETLNDLEDKNIDMMSKLCELRELEMKIQHILDKVDMEVEEASPPIDCFSDSPTSY